MKFKLKVEGHRGAMTNFYENSLEAFIEADRLGIDGVEFDLWLLKDNVPLVVHGKSGNCLEILWNIKKQKLETVFLMNITSLELENFTYPDKKTKLPTFQKLLETLKNSKLYLNAEIKDCRIECVEESLKCIKKVQPDCHICFSSFNHNVKNMIDLSAKKLGMYNFQFGFLASSVNDLPVLIDEKTSIMSKGDTINVDITLILANDEVLRNYILLGVEKGIAFKVYNLMCLSDFETPEMYSQIIAFGISTFTCNRVESLLDFNKL